MIQERIYKVLLGSHVSEKASLAADLRNQYVFRVLVDANKREIKKAVEKLFSVKVSAVRTVLVKGKTKKTRFGLGRRDHWKKAYVSLDYGQEINLDGLE